MARTGTPSRSAILRRRLIAAGIALLAVIVIVLLASGGGSATTSPATAAAKLVPSDALVYVNVSLDDGRPGVTRALTLARRFPGFAIGAAAVQQRLGDLVAAGVDYATEIRPWLGHEAAFALLNPTGSTAGSLLLLSVADHARAASFLTRSGAQAAGRDDGVAVEQYASGTDAAFVGSFLALGQPASVRAAISVAGGSGTSLSASALYRRAVAGEPADRVIDAYASAAGVKLLLEPQSGLIGAAGTLLDQPALGGVAASVVAAAHGVQIRLHSVLDPTLLSVAGQPTEQFTPTLQRLIPSGSTVLFDTTELSRVAPHVLAAGAAAGIGGGLQQLLSRLGGALGDEGVNVSQFLSLFHGETTVAVTGGTSPALLIVARTADPAAVRSELASAAIPLQQLLSHRGATGQTNDTLGSEVIDGAAVRRVQLEPGLELDYAVNGGLVVISTGVQAISALLKRSHGLTEDPGYQAVLPHVPARVTSLTFLNFSQLLSLGEHTGLTRSASFRALRGDLQRIRAVGLSSSRGETDSTAEISLQIP